MDRWGHWSPDSLNNLSNIKVTWPVGSHRSWDATPGSLTMLPATLFSTEHRSTWKTCFHLLGPGWKRQLDFPLHTRYSTTWTFCCLSTIALPYPASSEQLSTHLPSTISWPLHQALSHQHTKPYIFLVLPLYSSAELNQAESHLFSYIELLHVEPLMAKSPKDKPDVQFSVASFSSPQ